MRLWVRELAPVLGLDVAPLAVQEPSLGGLAVHIGKGNTVSIMAANMPELPEAHFGGAPVVPGLLVKAAGEQRRAMGWPINS